MKKTRFSKTTTFSAVGVIVAFLMLQAACGGPKTLKPFEPTTPKETAFVSVLKDFLNSKKAGRPNDQLTCMEGTAQDPLEVKDFMITDVSAVENLAVVRITDEKSQQRDYEFIMMAADAKNNVWCILRFLPKK